MVLWWVMPRDPGLLQPEPLSPWQATGDLFLCMRHSNTQRQFWLSILWKSQHLSLGPGAHKISSLQALPILAEMTFIVLKKLVPFPLHFSLFPLQEPDIEKQLHIWRKMTLHAHGVGSEKTWKDYKFTCQADIWHRHRPEKSKGEET